MFTSIMSKKLLISIVDDNHCFRKALEALMISMGYNVAAFESAEDYLVSDCVAQTSCLISDWQMPGMSGADLQDRLIAEGHRIPVIFVTAGCTEMVRTRMLNAGALTVLPKPFDVRVLIEYLNKAPGAPDRSS
jgi:FixJ family two-component response regulator